MSATIIELLQELKRVGAAWQREDKAQKIMDSLFDLLPADDYLALKVARNHYLTGEGRAELDQECNRIINKYRQNRPGQKPLTLL